MRQPGVFLFAVLATLVLTGCAPETEKTEKAGKAEKTEKAEKKAETAHFSGISTEYEAVRLVRLSGGLSHPWSVAFLPDGGYLITERPGRLRHFDGEDLVEVAGVPDVHVENQGGLLDVVLHPDYEDNGWLYLTWSKGDAEATTVALSRARLDLEERTLVDRELLFEQDRRSEPGRHYGSRLAWKADGTLLMSVGDRGAEPERAQDPGDHAGTLLRLTETGGVPDDNPFVDDDEVLDEIYTWGHRNIQGLVIDPDSGDIWATEHGPRGGDELNLIRAGENYGWPEVGKGRDYQTQEPFGETRSRDDVVDPVYEILPTHAPSGLALVTRDIFPGWEGELLAGGLRSERIRRLVVEDQVVVHDEELFHGKVGRIRDVRQGPEGHIYVLTDNGDDDGLWRVEPEG